MIPLPTKPKIVEEKGKNKALFKVEGLYPGYGVTVGNSLRRVLLSSLGGAAITKVKIDGVNHEFSTISGVMEDVITIILNLKELRFRIHSDEEQTIKLKIKGDKEVKGSDFKLPSQVELKNPDAHIATITDKNTSLELEAKIEKGIGYSAAEDRKEEKLEVGQIIIDAIFTPVRRANFNVENMRVGKRTDFDRLFIEIETDGTISPEESFIEAAGIMEKHFSLLSSFQGDEEDLEDKKEEEPEEDIMIDDLKISTRIANILKDNGIEKVDDITEKTEEDIISLKGMGKKGVEEIKKALKKEDIDLKVKE